MQMDATLKGMIENLVMQMSFMRMQMRMWMKMFIHEMSNAKILFGYANMNAAMWWCKWKFLVMQMLFMQMQMYVLVMYMLVMHGFAPAWAYRCKCSQMMRIQVKTSLLCKCLPGRCICECYDVMQMFELILMEVQKIHCSILVQKQIILFNLEFQWSSSGIPPSKINMVFWKV